jgi:hypothetical protein
LFSGDGRRSRLGSSAAGVRHGSSDATRTRCGGKSGCAGRRVSRCLFGFISGERNDRGRDT